MLVPGIIVFAQAEKAEEVEANPEEWERFKAVYAEMTALQEELRQKEQNIVENSSFDKKSFQNMYDAYVDNNQGVFGMASESQKEEFSKVMEEIFALQNEYRNGLSKIIEQSDFSARRFYQLLHAYEQ